MYIPVAGRLYLASHQVPAPGTACGPQVVR